MEQSWNVIAQELGIILWKVRYPVVTHKKSRQVLMRLRCLIISDVSVSLNDLFIKDVMQSMQLNSMEVYALTIDQISSLTIPLNFLHYCWWIGVKSICNFHCITLSTPSLSVLKNNIQSKLILWNQIYHHVYNR